MKHETRKQVSENTLSRLSRCPDLSRKVFAGHPVPPAPPAPKHAGHSGTDAAGYFSIGLTLVRVSYRGAQWLNTLSHLSRNSKN